MIKGALAWFFLISFACRSFFSIKAELNDNQLHISKKESFFHKFIFATLK